MNFQNQIFNNFNEINDNELTQNISILCMNIRSIRKNFTEFLIWTKNIINKIKIIVLTETNINDNENQFYQINGYNSVFLNREGRGGGIAIYINEDLHFKNLNSNTTSFESMKLELIFNSNDVITIVPCYRPPNMNIKTFIDELDQSLNEINKKQGIILVGDMNIDISVDNRSAKDYLDMCATHGLQCLITGITREDEHGGSRTCIDHIFVRHNGRQVSNSGIIATTISDHYTIFGCIKTETIPKKSDITKPKINNKKVNFLIKNTDWKNLVERDNDSNQLFNDIYNVFCEIYEKCSEPKKIQTKNRNGLPWLTHELLQCCNIRDNLYKNYRKNKNTMNEKIYKTFNNQLNKKIISAKNQYFYREFAKNRGNIRQTWQTINQIIGKKTSSIDETIKTNFPNQNITEITEHFAQQFKSNVENIVHVCEIKILPRIQTNLPNTMFLEETNEEEVKNVINSLNTRKSPGIDGIRASDIRTNVEYTAPILTALINKSINENIIPNLLKISIIRPIYKNGIKSAFENYRPIAILPIIEKVLEEIISRRLSKFLEKYNIINRNQYGFQKGKNINQLLGNFANVINQNLSEQKQCLAMFIDFSKAFDTLSHAKLLDILEKNGIRGHSLKWFENYLYCRSFRVKIDNHESSEYRSAYGVPQGSKLGPILFIIYANDMVKYLKDSITFSYADDTTIIVADKSIQRAELRMQSEMNLVTKWCHDNGLVINSNKTKLMHFRPKHIPKREIPITFHNYDCLHKNHSLNDYVDTCTSKIEVVDQYKYLGIILDSHFKWRPQIDNVRNKLRKSSYAIYHLSNCAPYHVVRQAYFSLVESYLRHGITAWGNAANCRILQAAQNSILKNVYKLIRTPDLSSLDTYQPSNQLFTTNHNNRISTTNSQLQYVNRLCKILSILNITNLYKSTILNEFFEDTVFLQHLNHTQNTRRRVEGRYHIPRFRNEYGRRTLAVSLPAIMNELPVPYLCIRNKPKRKKVFKIHLLNSQ